MERRRLRMSTAELAVHEYGGMGPAETTFLLHGGLGCPDYLEPVAELLVDRYRVVGFDRRGVGGSIALNGSYIVRHYVWDLEELRRWLRVDRVHLLGHSWGGLLAQLYAAAAPERVLSLFLCNSALGFGEDWRRNQRQILRHDRQKSGWTEPIRLGAWWALMALPGRIGQHAAEQVMRHAWKNYFPDPKAALEPDEAWLRGARSAAMRRTERSLRRARAEDLNAAARRIDCPVLVLYGRRHLRRGDLTRP